MFCSLDGPLIGSLFQMHQKCIKIYIYFYSCIFSVTLFFHLANIFNVDETKQANSWRTGLSHGIFNVD